MDQVPCSDRPADRGRDNAPFVDERNRYLGHCAKHGAAPAVLKMKRNELLWIAGRLGPDARQGVGMDVLQRIALSAAKPPRGGHRRAESGQYRATMATISRLVA